MAKKKNKVEYCRIANCEETRVLDTPESGASIVCQLKAGRRVKIVSKPNRYYVGILVSPSVVGFVKKDFIQVE